MRMRFVALKSDIGNDPRDCRALAHGRIPHGVAHHRRKDFQVPVSAENVAEAFARNGFVFPVDVMDEADAGAVAPISSGPRASSPTIPKG